MTPPKKNGTHLFLDASGRAPVAAVWRGSAWLGFHRENDTAATEGFFSAVEISLKNAAVSLENCDGFFFISGPGSILGIRVAAMALRGWLALPAFEKKPVFAAGKFALAAKLLLLENPARRDFSVFADSRQNWWNAVVVRGGVIPKNFEEMRGEQLTALPEPRFRITQRASAMTPVPFVDFDETLLEKFPGALAEENLFSAIENPDAQNLPGEFSKWTPERHR